MLGAYVRRWSRWARAGLDAGLDAGVLADGMRFRGAPGALGGPHTRRA